ncbi:hypothetical protein OG21DRAFT_1441794 [Imleria badia]|nr:hypothetical protein OG21DRAFT_1441794 [Imleria badia]
MIDHGIPLDKAELLSVLLEGILHGFSLLMFGGTIWVLFSRRSTHRPNHTMLTVAFLLLVLSTAHLAIHIIRVMEGLIMYRDTYRGGPIAYFSDVSQWTFVSKNHVYTAQTLIGDSVILYRCYMVWQSKLIMILPVLLWFSAGVTGIATTYTAQHVTQTEVFGGSLSIWITSFWVLALATNLLTTLLLVIRIWYVHRKAKRLRGHRNSQLGSILHILIDAGVIYSLTLLVALICFVIQTNGQYVILDMITPIISITFYMVIIRVGVVRRANQATGIPLGNTFTDNSLSTERRNRMQVHITTLTESKIENGPLSPIALTSHTMLNKNRPSEIKFEDIGGAV